MLTFITLIKLIAEIAWLALLGQWVLGLLAGQRKDRNVFYQLLQQVGNPIVRLTRCVTPSRVLERHQPLVAFLSLSLLWLVTTVAKIHHCLQIGVWLCQ